MLAMCTPPTTPTAEPVVAVTPSAVDHRQKGLAMFRHLSRRRAVTRRGLLALALTLALLGGLAQWTPAADAQAPPLPPLPTGLTLPTPVPVPQQVCASLAAVQPAAVRDPLLAQAGCPPVADDDFWGIHQNGWHVCVVNTTNRPLYPVTPGFTDNVAVLGWVDAHAENCAIRGTASWFGGPANMNFQLYQPYGTLDRPHEANVRVLLRSWTHNNSPVLDFTCYTWEKYIDDDLLQCSVDTSKFSLKEPVKVTVAYR
jgi:hypothetical protein